jgi:3-hydroxyisobutyrate dehydrogenase
LILEFPKDHTTMQIGFIGLGTMGAPMALNLLKAGHPLVVNDLCRDAGTALLEAGAQWAATPAELGGRCTVVFSSLPGPAEIEAVGLAEGGLLDAMAPDSAWIDLSTGSAELARRLAARGLKRGIHMLDAPVSGGLSGARSGRLALYVGGSEEAFIRYRPLLDAIGDQVMRVGETGAGTVAKLAHNCAALIFRKGMAEVFALGVKGGVEPLALWHALRQGASGRRRSFDGIEQFLNNNYLPASFALKLAHKDMALATDMGRTLKVPMPLAELALCDMTESLNRGWGDRDGRSAMQLTLERAGVAIEAPLDAIRATQRLGDS